MKFGYRLKDIRITNKISQDELSKLTKIPQTTISDHENNKYLPDIEQVLMYTKAFGIEIKDFFNFDSNI